MQLIKNLKKFKLNCKNYFQQTIDYRNQAHFYLVKGYY